MARKQVLCVEDNAFVLVTLRHLLETLGYDVVGATNGKAALATGDKAFDLVILDYDLPDTDGFAIARELRKRHECLPILMYSGCPDIPRQATQDISAFVSKSDRIQILLETIATLTAA